MGLEAWEIIVGIAVGIIGAIGTIFAVYFGFKQLRKQHTDDDKSLPSGKEVSNDNVAKILAGFEEHKQLLQEKIVRLEKEAAVNEEAKQQLIEVRLQLATIQAKLSNQDQLIAELQQLNTQQRQEIARLHADGSKPAEVAARVLELLADKGLQAATPAYGKLMQSVDKVNEYAADVAYQMGQQAKTEVQYPQALHYFEDAVRLAPDNGVYVNALAIMLQTLGHYADALPHCEHVLALAKKDSNQRNIATASNNLASLYESKGKYDDAEVLYKKAIAIDEQVLGDNHPGLATDYNNLASLYLAQRKYNLAEALLQQVINIFESALGKTHPLTATAYNNLAELYRTQGNYDLAEPLYKKAIAIDEQVLGTNHPDTARDYNNLASLYNAQGKYYDAEALCQQSLTIREDTLGKIHPDTAQSYNNLASLYHVQGNYDLAEPLYNKAITISEQTLGADHPTTQTFKANYQRMLAKKAGRQAGGE